MRKPAGRNRQHFGRITVGDTVPYILKNAPCEVLLERAGCSAELSEDANDAEAAGGGVGIPPL